MEEDRDFISNDNLPKSNTEGFVQEKKIENRDLEIFSDDLYIYLLPRRIKVTDYSSLLKRTPEDPISNFHPHIGMSVLCYSYLRQKVFFLSFLKTELDSKSLDSIAQYFTNYTKALHAAKNTNVFRKLQMLASLTLELCVFCYLRGNKNAIYYAQRLYLKVFQHTYKNDFINSGGWNAWIELVSNEAKFYIESEHEVPDINTRTIKISGWLNKYDQWITSLNLTAEGKEADKSDTAQKYERTFSTKDEMTTLKKTVEEKTDEKMERKIAKAYPKTHLEKMESLSEDKVQERTHHETESKAEEKVKCTILKDCPETKKYKRIKIQIILDLKQIVSQNKDSSYEQLIKIIESDTCVNELLRFCIFPQLVIGIKNSDLKMRNIDILQYVKLLLRGNSRMAAYCCSVVQQIYEQVEKSYKGEDVKKLVLDVTERNLGPQEINLDVESSEPFAPKKVPVYQTHKYLLANFLREIKPNDEARTPAVSEICEILLNEKNAEIILNSSVFRSIMKIAVNNPNNNWDDEWMLSIMKLIDGSEKSEHFFKHLATNCTQTTDRLSNEVSVSDPNPQTKLASNIIHSNVIKPTGSLVEVYSPCRIVKIGAACDNDSSIENQRANTNQNIIRCKLCIGCLNPIKEQALDTDYSVTIQSLNPIRKNAKCEIGVEKRKKQIRRKSKRSIVRTIRKTSVHDRKSYKIKSFERTRVVKLALTNLCSVVTGKGVKQTLYPMCKACKIKYEIESDLKTKCTDSDDEIPLEQYANLYLKCRRRQEMDTDTGKVLSEKIIFHFKNAASLLPSDISSAASTWILDQTENDADLLDLIEMKFITDSQLKKAIFNIYNVVTEKLKRNEESTCDDEFSEVLPKDNSSNLKDEGTTSGSKMITDLSTLSNILSENNSSFDEIIEKENMEASVKAEQDFLDFLRNFENCSSLLPAGISRDSLTWILDQTKNDKDLSDYMAMKFITDEQIKKEIMNHYNTVIENFKEQ